MHQTAYSTKLIHGDADGGWYRIEMPGSLIGRMGLANVNILTPETKEFRFDPYSDPKLQWADLVLAQRVLDPNIMATLLHQRDKFGYSLVYEIDDNIFNVERQNPSYDAFMGRGKEDVIRVHSMALRDADHVVVSTDPLREVCEKYAGVGNVTTMRNAIDFNRLFLDNVFNGDIVK